MSTPDIYWAKKKLCCFAGKVRVLESEYQEVFALLRDHADPDRAVQMSAYMRDMFPYLGIQTPVRRKLTREFLKAAKKTGAVDWVFINECWQLEREFQYLALDYLDALSACLSPDDVLCLRDLALRKSWWDTIDHLDAIFGTLALKYPEINSTLLAWSTDENFWLRRIAIDHQLLYKDKTDTVLLEQIIVNNLGQTEFFINKAIGWALREYSKTDPDWVRGFVNSYQDQLAPLSVREASKYL